MIISQKISLLKVCENCFHHRRKRKRKKKTNRNRENDVSMLDINDYRFGYQSSFHQWECRRSICCTGKDHQSQLLIFCLWESMRIISKCMNIVSYQIFFLHRTKRIVRYRQIQHQQISYSPKKSRYFARSIELNRIIINFFSLLVQDDQS